MKKASNTREIKKWREIMFYIDRANFIVSALVTFELGTTNEKLSNCPNLKQALLELFKSNCAYCGCKVVFSRDAEIDHFIPKSPKLGDPTKERKWDNLVLSCDTCNGKTGKHTKNPVLNPCDEIESCNNSEKSKLMYDHEYGVFYLSHNADIGLKDKFKKSDKYINGVEDDHGRNQLKENRIYISNKINMYLRILQKFFTIVFDEWEKKDNGEKLNFVKGLSFNADHLSYSHTDIINIYCSEILNLIKNNDAFSEFVGLKIHNIELFINTCSNAHDLLVTTLKSIIQEVSK